MNQQEKKEFIDTLIESTTQSIKSKIKSMPDEWDGNELRQYIKDKFDEVVWPSFELKGKRKKKYENTVITKNL